MSAEPPRQRGAAPSGKDAATKSIESNGNNGFKQTIPNTDTVNVEFSKSDIVQKKYIELPHQGRNVNDFAAELAKNLKHGSLYLYGSSVAEIQKPRSDSEDSPIVTMDQVRFRTWVEDRVTTAVMKEDTWLDMTMSESVSKTVLVTDEFTTTLPRLSRVIDFPMPMLKADEIFIPKPGYNPETETYLQLSAPRINYEMSLEQAKIILDQLLNGILF